MASKVNRALDPVSMAESCLLLIGKENATPATLRTIISTFNAKFFAQKDRQGQSQYLKRLVSTPVSFFCTGQACQVTDEC